MIIALQRYAFVNSQLPVQISLEMHCSPPQQQKIATMFHEHLGEMLLTSDDLTAEQRLRVSPFDLQRKVLLKGKTAPLVTEDVTQKAGAQRPLTSLFRTLRPGKGKAVIGTPPMPIQRSSTSEHEDVRSTASSLRRSSTTFHGSSMRRSGS